MESKNRGGPVLALESHYGTLFRTSYSDILEAEYTFNRSFATVKKEATMGYFYELLGLDPPKGSKEIGWPMDYLIENWDIYWIDFVHRPDMTEDGKPCLRIDYQIEPVNMDWDGDDLDMMDYPVRLDPVRK